MTDDTRDARAFPALALMERTCPPLRFGHEPVWNIPDAVTDPYVPVWHWHAIRDFVPGSEVLTLETVGGLLDGIAEASIAHTELQHYGPWAGHPEPWGMPPGYYRITVPRWVFTGTIVSPLGDSARLETEDAVWVLAPTLQLLLELSAKGYLSGFQIIDSYVSFVTTSFRTWSAKLRAERFQRLGYVDAAHHQEETRPAGCTCAMCRRYAAFTAGYTGALRKLETGTGATHRPDWAHTVYATYAARQWRKAWAYTFTGMPLVSMGHVDELQVLTEDLMAVMRLPKKPVHVDLVGIHVGALQIKHAGHLVDEAPAGISLAKDGDA
jgi:hypothetical protein